MKNNIRCFLFLGEAALIQMVYAQPGGDGITQDAVLFDAHFPAYKAPTGSHQLHSLSFNEERL